MTITTEQEHRIMTIAQNLIDQLAQVNRDYSTARSKAQNHWNPDLTYEELHADRQKMTERARTGYAEAVAQVRAQARQARQWNTEALDRVPDAQGPTRDGWERAKMLLEAGRPLSAVVKYADPAMLHGIAEWAPTYLEARRGPESLGDGLTGGRQPLDLSAFQRSVRVRWAQLTEDEDLTAALSNAPTLAKLEAQLDNAEATAEGRPGGGLDGAVAAHYAAQAASIDLEGLEAAATA